MTHDILMTKRSERSVIIAVVLLLLELYADAILESGKTFLSKCSKWPVLASVRLC